MSLSRSLFPGSGFNVETEDDIFTMMFYSEDAVVRPLFSTSSLAGVLFGAIHCIAWDFSFPSHVEQIMWRTACLGVIGSCFMSLVGAAYASAISRRFGKLAYSVLPSALIFVALLYPVARITLLVLSITSLRSLPPAALHTVEWAEFVPHV